MTVKIHIAVEFVDIKSAVTGLVTPGAAYAIVKNFQSLRGYKRTILTPEEKGEAIKGGRFEVAKGDDIRAKFQGWHNPDVSS